MKKNQRVHIWGVDRLAKKVRAHFPTAKTVSDARERVVIHVTQADRRKAVPNDPGRCAMAIACRREQRIDGAWIGLGTSYLRIGTHLIRYTTPESVAREIVTFDRHTDFEPGDYALAAVSRSALHQMGAHRRPADTHRGSKRPRGGNLLIRRHRTLRVR